jgi:hypothetical protein
MSEIRVRHYMRIKCRSAASLSYEKEGRGCPNGGQLFSHLTYKRVGPALSEVFIFVYSFPPVEK